jgi:hypothetical protein
MIREICKDEAFLSPKAEPATPDALPLLLLRGGVPRLSSFPTVVGEQPNIFAMARFEHPCALSAWIAPRSSA